MYDTIIIGLGAAGYTAAIYGARYKLRTLILGEREGGTGMSAAEVGDWPGIQYITGPELMENFKKHALSFEGVEHKLARVEKVEAIDPKDSGKGFRLTLQGGTTLEGKTLVFAMGTKHRKLGVLGEDRLAGKGVSYCATCDAYFFKGKDIAIIGGGDAAVEGAAIAAQVAGKVYLIHRRKEFRAEPYWVDRVKARQNVTFILERTVLEILGKERVEGVKLDKPLDGKDTIPLQGVFVEIGADPDSALAKALGCTLDERGFVAVDGGMRTNIPGVFAAGDVTNSSNHFAQFTTAAAEGSIAANSVFNYLEGRGKP